MGLLLQPRRLDRDDGLDKTMKPQENTNGSFAGERATRTWIIVSTISSLLLSWLECCHVWQAHSRFIESVLPPGGGSVGVSASLSFKIIHDLFFIWVAGGALLGLVMWRLNKFGMRLTACAIYSLLWAILSECLTEAIWRELLRLQAAI